MTPDRPASAPSPDVLAHVVTEAEQAILDAIRATPYGSVEVVLHQARIVQVVRTQKLRLDAPTD
jgi:hypothetical protein